MQALDLTYYVRASVCGISVSSSAGNTQRIPDPSCAGFSWVESQWWPRRIIARKSVQTMAIVEKWMKPWPQDFTRNVMIIELATIWNLIRNLGAVSPYHWTSGLGHASNIRDVICDLIQFLPWETSGIWLPGLYVSSCGKLWATNQMVLTILHF